MTQISIQESDLGQLRDHAFEGLRNVGELRILNNKASHKRYLDTCRATCDHLWTTSEANFFYSLPLFPYTVDICCTAVITVLSAMRKLMHEDNFLSMA